jgi:hypothetical protein
MTWIFPFPGGPLKRFLPRNKSGSAALNSRFQGPGRDLKFELPDGAIDFLCAPLQASPGFSYEVIEGRHVALETRGEVIVRKIRFRSATFAARDVFDLAAIALLDRDLPILLANETPDVLPRLKAVISARASRDGRLFGAARPTPAFSGLVKTAPIAALEAIEAALERTASV